MNSPSHNAIMKTITGQQYERAFTVERSAINVEARTVELSFSSEAEYKRSFGIEILDHGAGAVDLTRLRHGAPLLINHDPDQHVGIVEDASIDTASRKGRALVRLGQTSKAADAWQNVQDGILVNVSVSYMILDVVAEKRDGEDVYRVTRWQPLEVSLVSVPADFTVGVGRSTTPKIEPKLPTPKEKAMGDQVDNQVLDTEVVRNEAIKGEQKRVAEILEAGTRFNQMESARQAISSGMSVADFNRRVLDSIAANTAQINSAPARDQGLGLSPRDIKQYSLLRAMKAASQNDWSEAGLELEMSRATAKLYGRQPKGFFVPFDIMRRDLDFTTEATDLVKTNLMSGSLIDILRKKAVVRTLGATMLEGIVGNIDIPRLTGGATFYMAATENAGVNESTQTYDKLSLSPKTGMGYSEVSQLLLNQASLTAEQMIINDMARCLAIGIDTQALNGAHVSGETDSVIHSAGNTVSISGAIDDADVINFETLVAADDADEGNLAYLTTPTVRGLLKTAKVNATYGETRLWQNGNKGGEGIVNGYRAVASNVVPAGYMIFGNWADLIVTLFAPGVDIQMNPYAKLTTRMVQVVAAVDFDCGLRHANSFAIASGITS